MMSHPVPQLNWSLVPEHYDQWLSTERSRNEALDKASTVRPVSIMPWNDHVVSEGYVEPNDMNLRRALRELGIDTNG